ncbi:MAG: flavin reductase [Candidatus Krumholzibacteriia bacterium]
MPRRSLIPVESLTTRPVHLFDKQWLLLTAGDLAAGEFNSMTVSWGSLGVIWHRPFAMVVVRPNRHTYGFMERFDTFTLCAFPEAQRDALNLMGTRSGRDLDKVAATGLTPEAATAVPAPVYREAELAIECRKIYLDDLDPARFLDPKIMDEYPGRDFHRMYFGEILAASGGARFGGGAAG